MQNTPSLFNLHEINPIVRLFIMSDFFIVGGLGLLAPIFAIFITDYIPGSTIETVGIATTIYLITKSMAQMPVGILIDRYRGQKDDMLLLIVSSLGFAAISIAYIFIKTPTELYLLQFIYGILAAASFPTWLAVFTRAIDKGKEGFEWSAYQTIADFGAAITAFLGSFVAATYGFTVLFVTVSIFCLIGTASLIWAEQIMFGKHKRKGASH